MENKNLYCLSVKDSNFTGLNFLPIDKAPVGLEVDLKNGKWRNSSQTLSRGDKPQEGKWQIIGLNGVGSINSGCDVRLVFDVTNIDHIEKALEVVAEFHR
ncbi:MAG TPA: hypothetical protein PK886_00570 [Candidatus Paceibacterota bacterium]|nr:hypothetical protein [Candidatus Paceibacterota bacterium]